MNDKETGYKNYIGKEINTNATPAAEDANFFNGFMFLVGMSNYWPGSNGFYYSYMTSGTSGSCGWW
jgi:hypothetical protein